MTEDQPIWQRIDYERDKAFALFCIYRDLGPTRSIEKVSVKFLEDDGENITSRQLERYSSKFKWVERASAYDDYLDQIQIEKNLEAIEEMNKRHAEDAQTVQKAALDDLNSVYYDDGESKASVESRRNAAARTWDLGVKNERLARGAATEKIEQSGKIKQELSGEVKTEGRAEKIKDLFREAEKGNDAA